jgi:Tol biopolymer transport system component
VIGGVVVAGSPDLSPDGRQVAFVVDRIDYAANRARTQIWVAATDGRTAPRPLTSGDTNDLHPHWSPDGRSLAFVSRPLDKKGEAALHVMPMDGPGEVRTIATMNDGIRSVGWSPDGTWISFTSRTQDARYSAEDESWQAPRKVERFFTQLNGEGWIYDRPSHVYLVPADGTSAPRNLTPGPFQHDGTSWLADSSAIVTSAQRHETWDIDLATDIYVIPIDGAEITPLTAQTGVYLTPSVSPDGTRVACIGNDDPLTDPQNQHVGIITLATGHMRSHRRPASQHLSGSTTRACSRWQMIGVGGTSTQSPPTVRRHRGRSPRANDGCVRSLPRRAPSQLRSAPSTAQRNCSR